MLKTTQLSFPAADPFILRAVDGRYYLYCTSEDGSGIPIHVSDDLVHWQRCGTAIGKDTARWGVGCFWAPECYEINGKYYLFYSADWKENPTGALENFRIGVAVADDPAGRSPIWPTSRFLTQGIPSSMPTFTPRMGGTTFTIPAAAMSTMWTALKKAGSTAWS